MRVMNMVKEILWNGQERRLRVLWRLCLHTLLLPVLIFGQLFGAGIIAIKFGAFTDVDYSSILTTDGLMQLIEDPWIGFAITIAACLSIFTATFISGRWIDHRRFSAFGLHLSKKWWLDLCFGLALGALLMGLVFLSGWLTGSIRITGFLIPSTEGGKFLPGFIVALVKFLLVGCYEELLSRGYHLVNLSEGLNASFGKRWALILALIISSVAFGLLHWDNPNASWISTLNIVLAGFLLGLGMVLTGDLAISIGLHITWNFFQGNIFGFPVSGTSSGATLIATELVGPKWLTGGAFGPEAGLMGLAVMVIGGLLIVLWVRRKGKLQLCTDLAVYEPLKNN